MINLPPHVNTALSRLEAAGYEAFVVGGAIRDSLLGRGPAKDWDLTTSALPAQVKEVFSDFPVLETGLKHGTVTILMPEGPLEVTTYRTEGSYSDHRHPDSVRFGGTLEGDLSRRDFTVNALAYGRQTGVVDQFGGRSDLARGVIRCVGEPDQRFREDGLRILRALRFASVLGMTVEKATAAAIHESKTLLQAIAPERIRAELNQLLCGPNAGPVLREFSDVFAIPIPELAPMFGLEQKNPYHDRDVWEHTIAVVSAALPLPVLRWSALLHDVGKPLCFFLDCQEVGHFYGHEAQSSRLAEEILSRLRFDNAQKERILALVRYHGLPILADQKMIKRLLNQLGADTVRQLILLHEADTLGQASACGYRLEIYRQAAQVMERVLAESACFSLKDLAVNGHDMLAAGLQGKEVGAALRNCLDAVIEERVPNIREALLEFITHGCQPAG